MIGWLERWQIPLYLVALGAGAACGSGITEPTPCPRSRVKAPSTFVIVTDAM